MAKVGTHETFEVRFDSRAGSDRSFGLTMAGFFALLGLLPAFHLHTPHWWWLAGAMAMLLLALVMPAVLHPFNVIWLRFGLYLHKVVTPIVMAFLFYSTVTPVGLLMRLFGKRPLPLRPDPNAVSYWIARNPPGPAPETMKHQF
jgi:hypothetical protein